MSAQEAMAEIWGTVCPDCGPEDNEAIVEHVGQMDTKLQQARDLVLAIEKYGFTCEAGDLKNAVEWIALRALVGVRI